MPSKQQQQPLLPLSQSHVVQTAMQPPCTPSFGQPEPTSAPHAAAVPSGRVMSAVRERSRHCGRGGLRHIMRPSNPDDWLVWRADNKGLTPRVFPRRLHWMALRPHCQDPAVCDDDVHDVSKRVYMRHILPSPQDLYIPCLSFPLALNVGCIAFTSPCGQPHTSLP